MTTGRINNHQENDVSLDNTHSIKSKLPCFTNVKILIHSTANNSVSNSIDFAHL